MATFETMITQSKTHSSPFHSITEIMTTPEDLTSILRGERKSAQVWSMIDILNDRIHELDDMLEKNKCNVGFDKSSLCSASENNDTEENTPKPCTAKTATLTKDFLGDGLTKETVDEDDESISDSNHNFPPSTFAFRDPGLVPTDTGKKLESMFQRLFRDTSSSNMTLDASNSKSDGTANSNSNCNQCSTASVTVEGKSGTNVLHGKKSNRSKAKVKPKVTLKQKSQKRRQQRVLSRLETERQEKRRNIMYSIQKQLEKNSENFVARAANTLRFKIDSSKTNLSKLTRNNSSGICPDEFTDMSHDEHNINPQSENWPIPLGGIDMNPKLLLKLSLLKAALSSCNNSNGMTGPGFVLLKRLVLCPISCNLYVYLFWFIHCRFFQPFSSSEQRYLLGKIATIFPLLMSSLINSCSISSNILGSSSQNSASSSNLNLNHKSKDYLYRCYPFVMSKAIYLGYRYLCPGNHNLFRGPFQRILNLSVFRLITGIDISWSSIDAICFNLYDSINNIPTINTYGDQKRDGRDESKFDVSRKDTNEEDENVIDEKPVRRKRANRKITSNDTNTHIAEKPVPIRQLQENFDANQISPLLKQCLDNTHNNSHNHIQRKKQILRQTKPAKWCEIANNSNNTVSTSASEKILQDHKSAKKAYRIKSRNDFVDAKEKLKQIDLEWKNIFVHGASDEGKSLGNTTVKGKVLGRREMITNYVAALEGKTAQKYK